MGSYAALANAITALTTKYQAELDKLLMKEVIGTSHAGDHSDESVVSILLDEGSITLTTPNPDEVYHHAITLADPDLIINLLRWCVLKIYALENA